VPGTKVEGMVILATNPPELVPGLKLLPLRVTLVQGAPVVFAG